MTQITIGVYRISISSYFAKLYSVVLSERLIDAIEKFDLISQEQIGFLKVFRTTDHSFIINSIVNKLVKENNKDNIPSGGGHSHIGSY